MEVEINKCVYKVYREHYDKLVGLRHKYDPRRRFKGYM